ncbi:MAG: small multi-drug export protein [Candidatus Limivicinus sp.]|nr:small multi-drug export protein [Candidatus Limivicinus sp.]
MFEWIAGTTAGKFISTFFISMLPVVELRAGLPYGIALGLDYPLALTAAVIGNMIPVPFIIIFIQRVFIWLRRHWPKMDSFITKLEAKAHLKGEKVQKYGPIALLLFVGIPLPGTGAWTGSLIAALLELKPKSAIPCIFLGVLLAAAIMTALTFGVIHVVN